jgi:hypothetical protein
MSARSWERVEGDSPLLPCSSSIAATLSATCEHTAYLRTADIGRTSSIATTGSGTNVSGSNGNRLPTTTSNFATANRDPLSR